MAESNLKERTRFRSSEIQLMLWLLAGGLALGAAGLWGGRPGLTAAGAVLLLGGCFTLWLWRRYRRTLEEIQVERADMRDDLQAIRSLLRSR